MQRVGFIEAGAAILLLLTLCVAALGVWIFVWRRAFAKGWRAARGAAPKCPKCGYSLAGLTLARCPECGSEWQLEELWRHVER